MQECDRLKRCKEGGRTGTTEGPTRALCVKWKGAHNLYLEDTFAIALKNGVSWRYRKDGRDAQMPLSAEQAAIFCPVGSNLQLSISACKDTSL